MTAAASKSSGRSHRYAVDDRIIPDTDGTPVVVESISGVAGRHGRG